MVEVAEEFRDGIIASEQVGPNVLDATGIDVTGNDVVSEGLLPRQFTNVDETRRRRLPYRLSP